MASAACAEALREGGFDGSIVLVGRESDPPYNRPPITKGYLAGAETRGETLVHPAEWWADRRVDVRTRTSVTGLDTDRRVATLSTREEVEYDRALLATGANVRRLPVEGGQLDGLHYLRALRNADVLRQDLEGAERVVMVGGSYIGAETAATLTALGRRCTIVMQEDLVLSRGFGELAGRWVQDVLEDHGVEVHGGQEVARFDGTGRVERVVCASGLVIDADAVVIGAGAVPDVMLARAAGLELGESGGVRCDARLRTSADGVWAAGDVCEYDSLLHGRRLRIEHWDVAVQQGRHVAAQMLGDERPYCVVPYFFSDLADWASLEYVGPAVDWEVEDVRGSMDEGRFSVFYERDGRLLGALSVGRPADLEEARARMAEQLDSGA